MKKLFESSQNELGGVYKITNLINNRFYIGSTNLFLIRYKKHISMLKKNKHDNKFLQNDFNHCNEKNNLGTENFSFEILEIIKGNKLTRTTIEQKYLDIYYDNHFMCYNLKKFCIENDPKIVPNKIKSPEEIKRATELVMSLHTEEYHKQHSEYMKNIWKKPEFLNTTGLKLKIAHMKPIIVTILSTGEELYFESVIQTSEKLKIGESCIRTNLNKTKKSKIYNFRFMDKEKYLNFLKNNKIINYKLIT